MIVVRISNRLIQIMTLEMNTQLCVEEKQK